MNAKVNKSKSDHKRQETNKKRGMGKKEKEWSSEKGTCENRFMEERASEREREGEVGYGEQRNGGGVEEQKEKKETKKREEVEEEEEEKRGGGKIWKFEIRKRGGLAGNTCKDWKETAFEVLKYFRPFADL